MELFEFGCAHKVQNENFNKAQKCALKKKPVSPEEFLCNAKILYSLRMYPEAVEVLLRGMKRWGENPAFLKQLAGILKKAGLKDEAKKYLERAEKYETSQGKKGK